MPYHLFEINAFQQLTYLESEEEYRPAKQKLRELRTAGNSAAGTTYRMMFASDPLHAERLLKEKREPRPMGEHD